MPSGRTGAACLSQICFLQGDMPSAPSPAHLDAASPCLLLDDNLSKKAGILITIITKLQHTVKKQSQKNQTTSIYMIQVRRKETNLPVQNVSCENSTPGRLPSYRAVEWWECTPHGCDGHTVCWYSFHCGLASGCSTQPGTTELTEPSFPGWVATRCKALHERLHLPFSGHRSPKAPSQSHVVPLSPGCRSAPSTTPERKAR